jgi:two-component system chemotaxis response regulator CheB
MGKDGAAELLELKEQGATTIAQDKESSVIHGMPGAAIALGAQCHILNLESIASVLLQNRK